MERFPTVRFDNTVQQRSPRQHTAKSTNLSSRIHNVRNGINNVPSANRRAKCGLAHSKFAQNSENPTAISAMAHLTLASYVWRTSANTFVELNLELQKKNLSHLHLKIDKHATQLRDLALALGHSRDSVIKQGDFLCIHSDNHPPLFFY